MSPVSWSASRVWTISGRPVCAAAAICARKLSACSVARAVLVVEVEAGLADADHLGMARRLDQRGRECLPLLLRLVRMDADRAPDVAVALGDRPHLLELVEPRADGQHAGDARGPGARQHAGFVGRQLGEVEMAVAVDQHQAAFGST